MTRSFLLALAALPIAVGACAATPPQAATGPILAGYFDCVRERGVAISAHGLSPATTSPRTPSPPSPPRAAPSPAPSSKSTPY